MDKAARKRWVALLTALLLTVAAIFISPAPADVVEPHMPRASVPRISPAIQAAVPATVAVAPVFAEEGVADPFERRNWTEPSAEPTAPPPAPVQLTVAPVVLDPGPPPLPYRYVGRFSDDAGGVLYLARGENALVVRVGETLDGTYKVVALQARGVEIEHIPTGTKQTLPIPEAE